MQKEKTMKRTFKLICFGIWMYFNLRHLRPYHFKIKKYRDIDDYEKEREQILNSTIAWGVHIMKKFKVDLKVTGLENVPEGPVLFVSNHQGYADIPVYCAVFNRKQIGFVAKSSLGKIPVFGEWIRDIRSVFIERDDARSSLKTMEEGADLLSKGFSLVIYPEGTRSKGPAPGEFRKGALRLGIKAEVPIVPVTLNGTYHLYEEMGYPKPGATVQFHVHPAIPTKGLSKSEANALPEKVEEIILTKLEEFQAGER
jgi:1-acyl-sn-glycerol-3-phosphate acyltransferase